MAQRHRAATFVVGSTARDKAACFQVVLLRLESRGNLWIELVKHVSAVVVTAGPKVQAEYRERGTKPRGNETKL